MNEEISFLMKENVDQFCADMQAAFQYGFEQWDIKRNEVKGAELDDPILPYDDIYKTLDIEGALACQIVSDGKLVGGAIFSTDFVNKRGELLLLYVKVGCQNSGLGEKIWNWIEMKYPEILSWETITPYHDKRNIHFYINKCGFLAINFYTPKHKDLCIPGEDYAFHFEKRLRDSNDRK